MAHKVRDFSFIHRYVIMQKGFTDEVTEVIQRPRRYTFGSHDEWPFNARQNGDFLVSGVSEYTGHSQLENVLFNPRCSPIVVQSLAYYLEDGVTCQVWVWHLFVHDRHRINQHVFLNHKWNISFACTTNHCVAKKWTAPLPVTTVTSCRLGLPVSLDTSHPVSRSSALVWWAAAWPLGIVCALHCDDPSSPPVRQHVVPARLRTMSRERHCSPSTYR